MNFEFIADKRFQDLLVRDYQELKKCSESKSAKSVLILSGSIIEAVLIEFFLQFPPKGIKESQILKSDLHDLINLAEQEKLLSTKEKNLASVIKDYRNLIHPGREIRKGEKFDFETANIAESLLNIIVNSIRTKYLHNYGHSAKDIIEKLKKDWYFHSIFGKVITKLNQNEKNNLLTELVQCEIIEKSNWDCFIEEGSIPQREYHNLEIIKPFVLELKPLVNIEIIKSFLKQLIKEIETGDSLKVFALYNLFHEEIAQLSSDEQEIIITYMLSIFTSVFERSNDLATEKTYSTIGKYINTDNVKKALNKFGSFCVVNFDYKNIENEMDVFEQVFNSLDDLTKEHFQKHIISFLSPLDNLPDDIKGGFYEVAVRRNIIQSL